MHEVPLLINITLALVVAFIGGVIARRLGLPTIVGYLLAGIAIGPFTPGFVGDTHTIQQLAELGVVFLMFGVGLHFSFGDLWRVRDIAIPGALIHTGLVTLLGFGLSRVWGWTPAAGVVLGLAVAVSSTVVLLRVLMDNCLLNTAHGQAAVGWLVMQDVLSVLILVLMPSLGAQTGAFDWQNLGLVLLKAAAFVALMALVGVRLIPWLLEKVALTRSRELFVLATLAITLGTALGAAELFGVSLALGAFVAGAIISQSHLSHQVGADVFSFREAFSVLFFVSVGMLVNPAFLWQNLGQVAALTFLVVFGKALCALLLGFFFPRPARTFLVVALGLSQIGEFSFILGQAGVNLKILAPEQYSLILAVALFSITLSPFLMRLLPWLERTLGRSPALWKKLEANRPLVEVKEEQLHDHVVIVGFGRVGGHLVDVLESLRIPLLVVEADAERIHLLNRRNLPALYGDPGSSEILAHAHLEAARALVSTVPDETTATLVVQEALAVNPGLTIIARAATQAGGKYLSGLGVRHVVQPELEGGLELVHHTLLSLGFPLRQVHDYAEAVRHDNYNLNIDSSAEHNSLHDLLRVTAGIEITWLVLEKNSPLVGKSLAEANIRSLSGASVVAIQRAGRVLPNPKSLTVFEAGDRLGLIGEEGQIEAVRELLGG